jgi:hypothetical protein
MERRTISSEMFVRFNVDGLVQDEQRIRRLGLSIVEEAGGVPGHGLF